MSYWVIYAKNAMSLPDGRNIAEGTIIETRLSKVTPNLPDTLGCLEVPYMSNWDSSHLVVNGELQEIANAFDSRIAISKIKVQRTNLLEDTSWTQNSDSPLTETCKENFRAWRVSLHRWLIDYPNGDVPLPDPPSYEYLPLESQV